MTIDGLINQLSDVVGVYTTCVWVIPVSDAKQIIHQALKKQREGALAEDESFSLAQYEHMVNGADLKEDMSLIDLARDSFAHGYFYAIKRLLNAPEPEL